MPKTARPESHKESLITEIKEEKEEIEEKPVIIETIQHEIFPEVKIKEEIEEDYELALPDDEYGEIEVLDEFIEEVRKMSPIKVKTEPVEPKKFEFKIIPSKKVQLELAQVKAEAESKSTSRMNLRGVKINLSKILGKKPQKPSLKHDLSSIEVPSCFNASERPFRCKKCPLSFKLRRELTIHRAIHKKADFWCRKCGQKFRFQASFLSHDCDFWCNICGKSISNKANLKIHMSYVHGVGQAKLFTCDLCGTTYKSKRNIDTHMKNHMESTPYNCAICGKGFSHAGALKIHMWNHRDLVNCEICKKKFKPRSLYYHIKRCRMTHEEQQQQNVDMYIKEERVDNVRYKVVQPQPVYVIKIKNETEKKVF